MPDAVLAIDQGTTGSTALVFSREGVVLGRAYAEVTPSYPHPGWVEQDAQQLWRRSLEVAAAALRAARVGARELKALGITNQRETTVLWDRATGEPVHPAIVWQSRQNGPVCERLRAGGCEGLVRRKTGLLLDPYFSGTKIAWIFEKNPEIRARAMDGSVLFGTVDAWLLWKLSGGAVHATDPTNASRTLLYDIHQRRWDGELCELLGVPPVMLPKVLPSSGLFGATTALDGIPEGVLLSGVAGDQQAALYGQQCWEPGQAKNTYGTGCFLLMNVGQRHPISDGGLLTTLCCDARGGPAYALEGAVFTAGAAVQWLRDGLGLIADAGETEALARSVPDSQGVYLVPAFTGLGAPYWDMEARGALLGLTRGVHRAHVVRAALESMAYQTRDVMEVMNRDAALPVKELRVDGGAAANDFLMQFQADLLGVPVERPALVETTAAGAAYLAGLGAGFWKSPDELLQARMAERTFLPEMRPGRREALYGGWKAAVRRTLSARPPAPAAVDA
jgi:glycerol kinase